MGLPWVDSRTPPHMNASSLCILYRLYLSLTHRYSLLDICAPPPHISLSLNPLYLTLPSSRSLSLNSPAALALSPPPLQAWPGLTQGLYRTRLSQDL